MYLSALARASSSSALADGRAPPIGGPRLLPLHVVAGRIDDRVQDRGRVAQRATVGDGLQEL